MSIWADKISDIVALINASSVYNTNRSTTPGSLGLMVYNQAQDYLCMVKAWRDLRVDAELTLDSDRKITMPTDFGCCIFVYTDPGNVGKPMFRYYPNDNNVALRYTEDVTYNSTTGARTIKYAFPTFVYIPCNPHVVYSKRLDNATADEVTAATKLSFFPQGVMLAVAKKILQDYYGVPANEDPKWINQRVAEEIQLLSQYAYQNNTPLDLSIHDKFGNPVFIGGMSMDGGRPRVNQPNPFKPSTMFTGGTY
jgi:hypothetical protein